MELFKLFGSIIVENAGANRALEQTADNAENTARRMDNAFERVTRTLTTGLIPAIGATAISLNLLNTQTNNTSGGFGGLAGASAFAGAVMTASLWGAVGVLSTALIPMLAVASAGVMAFAGAFTAVGIGVVGFGAVAIGVLGDVFEASTALTEAQKALNEATTDEERTRALEMQKEAMAGLSEEQVRAVGALQEFKSFWDSFKTSFETPVVNIFIQSLDVLKQVLELMKPAIDGAMTGISSLLSSLNVSLEGNQVKAFFEWIGNNAGTMIAQFGEAFGNIMLGIMNLMMAFAPMSQSVSGGLLDMTQRFANWSSTVGQSKGFQDFINYVTTNAPVVFSVIKGIIATVMDLLVALAPVGQQVLQLISDNIPAIQSFIAQLGETIANVSPSVLKMVAVFMLLAPVFAGVISAIISVIGFIITLIPVITTVWGWISKIITVVRSWGAVMALLSNPIGWIILAIGLIVGAIVLLWNKSEAFRSAVISIWNSIKAGIASAVSAIMPILQAIGNFIATVVVNYFRAVIASWQVAWAVLRSIVQAGVSMVTSVIRGIQAVVSWLASAWNSVVGAWSAIWNALRSLISSIISGIVSTLKSTLSDAVSFASNVWSGVKGVWSSAWSGLSDVVSGAINTIRGYIDGVANSLSWTTDAIKSAIKFAGKLGNLLGGTNNKYAKKEKPKRNANGTDYFQGGWTTVGEQGRELVKLPTGSQVIPNHSLPKDFGSGGGVTNNITIISPKSTASEIARKFKQASRQMAME